MALIGSVVNQGSMQGQINEANGNLTGLISSAELIGGQVVGMRGLKGDKGDQGDPGADGQDGADGFSPIANVSKVGDTATITITDSLGTTTATVEDGADGQDGQDGADGHSPVITANKVGKVTTVYADGVAIATINDGQDGGGSGVFIAEIGTTSYSDIDTAFQGGKLVIGRVSGTGDTYFPLVVDNSSYYNYYSFQVTSGKFVFEYKIDNTDEWTTSQYVIATDDEATTSKKGLMSSSDKTKLNGIASGAEANIQSDWNEADNTKDDFIKNKPTIPSKTSDLNNDSGFITGVTSTSTPTASTIAEFDSSAHMNSTDMSSQEVDDFVASLNATAINAVDYVVEQGTSGDWRYRKWNSGYMDATLRMSDPTIGSATTINGVQRLPINYPTPPTFNTITDVTASGHNSGAWVSAGFDGGGSVIVFLMRISGNTSTLSNFSMSLKGTWK